MRVLITGNQGQLGHELHRILEQGQSALGLLPQTISAPEIYGVDIATLDITDSVAVQRYIKALDIDIIINCAAYTNVDGCETEIDRAFKTNALGARNLALAAEQHGAKMVHISTDYVFAGNGDKPYCEWDTSDPRSIYGKSKSLGEQYVRDFCSRYFIIRTAWLYGHTGNNFVKTMLRLAREQGKIKVVNDQIGNPTNATDLAHHILTISATEEYGIYHCTGHGECSWHDFARKIVEYAGIECTATPCSTAEFPRPAKRPAYSALDNMMLRNTIGDAMRPWEEALKDFITKGA